MPKHWYPSTGTKCCCVQTLGTWYIIAQFGAGCTRARTPRTNSGVDTWKNGVFTLVLIKNRSRAPCSGTKSERSLWTSLQRFPYICSSAYASLIDSSFHVQEQYIFIHDALLEAVSCGNTEVHARNLLYHIKRLTEPCQGGMAGLAEEFRKLNNPSQARRLKSTGSLAISKSNERLSAILPRK